MFFLRECTNDDRWQIWREWPSGSDKLVRSDLSLPEVRAFFRSRAVEAADKGVTEMIADVMSERLLN